MYASRLGIAGRRRGGGLRELHGRAADRGAGRGRPRGTSAPAATDPPAQGDLGAYVSRIAGAIDSVPADRREPLQKIADFVRSKRAAGETPKLVFICTHNSRRSHIGQLWATAAAAHYGIDDVETYSGGTEATAFNPRAVAVLRRGYADRRAARRRRQSALHGRLVARRFDPRGVLEDSRARADDRR